MKKFLQLICLGFVLLLLPGVIWISGSFPVDTRPYVEKKYAGWNGVLQAWICTNWESGGNFIRWLNNCAATFEKAHKGVYIEITPVFPETIRTLSTSSVPAPDMVFFSPGVITSPNVLAPLQTYDLIRSDLRGYGKGHALPVALSGFIWVRNPALCDVPPQTTDEAVSLFLTENSGTFPFPAALLGLLSNEDETGIPKPSVLDPGIDLGLPSSAGPGKFLSCDMLDMFIDGKLACMPVDSQNIARLSRLRENGRGPDWTLSVSGSFACTDRLLMAGIPASKDGSEQANLSEEFIIHLLEEDSQSSLSEIGACSVSGRNIHSSLSVYAELDTLLNSRPLWLPDCFSEYSPEKNETIVRSFLAGDISAKNALSLMGFEGV